MQIAIVDFDDFTDIDLVLHYWTVRILGTKEFH